jgi:hypothetical protein
MVFNTPINNLIIDGNSFDYGKYTPDGNPASTATIYSYFNDIIVTSDAIITNNFVSGMAAPGAFGSGISSNLVIEANWSCVVQNNTFVRGNTNIYAYIVNNSTDDQIIINNVFDGYTVDGTDENLVKGVNATPTGLSTTSTYQNNKNQTGYMPIQKSPYLVASVIQNPPDPNFADYVYYGDLAGEFDTLYLNGLVEGAVVRYNNPFAQLGTPANGGFSVHTGQTQVACNFTIGGLLTLMNGIVRFDNGNYHLMAAQMGAPTVTQINLVTPYLGPTNSSAFAKFYNGLDGSSPLVYAGLPAATPTANFGILMDLNEILPAGVSVLNMVVGIYTQDASGLVGGSYTLNAFASNPGNFNLTSLNNTMPDVKNFAMSATASVSSNISIGTGPGQTPAGNFTNTQYLTIDLTDPANSVSAPFFVTGEGRKIPVIYEVSVSVTAGGTEALMQESPLIVKYRW